MNYRKFFVLFTFLITLSLNTVFADNIGKPNSIEKIFPDKLVARKIAMILNKSTIYEIVTQDELDCIKEFRYEGGKAKTDKISNISGIQYLNNLNNFTLTCGKINDLSHLSKLINLQKITLCRNKIIDITSLADLEKLEYLDLSCNLIVDLKPLSKLTNLYFLNIYCNKVEDISSLSSLKNLKMISIGQNPIINVSALSGLKKLTNVEAYGTLIPSDSYKQLYMYRNRSFIERWWSWIIGD